MTRRGLIKDPGEALQSLMKQMVLKSNESDREVLVEAGQAIDIAIGAAHRVENRGGETLVFIEVQRGDYLGEDDIVRLQDDFGRAPGK